jgi:hypothetical protein
MFVDDREEGSNERRDSRTSPPTRPDQQPAHPLADREVPLDRHTALSAAVHAWLDGELPEAAVHKGETAKDVEFWQMIGQETAQMRRVRTPPHLEALIMEALPQTVPQLTTPWYRREFVLTPTAAIAGAAVLVTLTAVVTALLLGAGR